MPTPDQLRERPYFDASHLPEPSEEYVAWFDVMGTQAHLSQSHRRAANFFAKIHVAAIRSRRDAVRLYPVMDGVYVTSISQEAMCVFIHTFYRLLAITFTAEDNSQHRFLVRGSLAFGPVTHGNTIPDECARFGIEDCQVTLLIGMPMIQAYQTERLAPPFGVFIHESARSFSPAGDHPLSGRWWRWWQAEDEPLISEMRVALPQFYDWAQAHTREFDYAHDAIAEHRAAAFEYFDIACG